MSDTVAEGIQVTTEEANKIQPDKGPMGRAGESFFAAEAIKAGAEGDPIKTAALQNQEAGFNAFMADQKDAVKMQEAHQQLESATLTSEPAERRVSSTMQENAAVLERMRVENPPQWQAVQAELAAAKSSPSPEAPTIMIKPSLRDRILTFLGFGKKQEPVRQ